ncbi:MAG: hypothetical protein ACJAS6_001320 [Rickettsiales bacterium]|jgi:hypothetical protein
MATFCLLEVKKNENFGNILLKIMNNGRSYKLRPASRDTSSAVILVGLVVAKYD